MYFFFCLSFQTLFPSSVPKLFTYHAQQMSAAAEAIPSTVSCSFHSLLPLVSAPDGWVLRLLEARGPSPSICKKKKRDEAGVQVPLELNSLGWGTGLS